MRPILHALLLLALTNAAQAGEAVDARAAKDWFVQYGAALDARDARQLAVLLDAQAPVVVQLIQGKDAPLQFTLTRDEYLQQTRALWRFATAGHHELSEPVFEAQAADGSRAITFTQKEQHMLFGTLTQQSSELRVRLVRKDGVLRIAGIEARTVQW